VHAQDPIGLIIGRMLACIVGLIVVLVLLNKYVLDRLFRLFAVTDEMLFIVTFAYALGV
jgi:Mg/Co/Ni transporter MgtE